MSNLSLIRFLPSSKTLKSFEVLNLQGPQFNQEIGGNVNKKSYSF